jgi:putative hydrolase of the HAD superfamily
MVVFFDAAGTLLHVRGGVGAQYAAVARRFGVDADPAALERAFPAAFRAAPPMAFPGASADRVPALERAVWQGIVRAVFGAAGLLPAFGPRGFEAYFDAVYAHFEAPAAWEVFPDVLPTLAGLAERGAEVGIISNFDSRLLRVLDGLGLAKWFASVTLSSRVGVTKPGAAIFAEALARHGAPAAAAVHVGDSLAEDYRGARAAGLGAVLVDRAGRYADHPDVRRAASLAEVVGMIRNTG